MQIIASIFLVTIISMMLVLAIIFGFYASWPFWWNGLFSESEYQFLLNLLSEGVGILLEATLIALIVGTLASIRETRQWKFMRTKLVDDTVGNVINALQVLPDINYKLLVKTSVFRELPSDIRGLLIHKHIEDYTGLDTIEERLSSMHADMDRYAPCISAKLAEFIIGLYERLDEIQILHKEKLGAFHTIGPDQDMKCEGETFLFLIKIMKAINSKCVELSEFIRLNSKKLSVYADLNEKNTKLLDESIARYQIIYSLIIDLEETYKIKSSFNDPNLQVFKKNNAEIFAAGPYDPNITKPIVLERSQIKEILQE